jgi:hypothetical protein
VSGRTPASVAAKPAVIKTRRANAAKLAEKSTVIPVVNAAVSPIGISPVVIAAIVIATVTYAVVVAPISRPAISIVAIMSAAISSAIAVATRIADMRNAAVADVSIPVVHAAPGLGLRRERYTHKHSRHG